MKVIYLDCIAGASGDMLLAGLLAAGASEAAVRAAYAQLALPGLELELEPVMRGAISALTARITSTDTASERRLADILALIDGSDLDRLTKSVAVDVFQRLGTVEGRIHGVDAAHVHLHELGGIDTIGDVVGVIVALHSLAPDEVVCSPLPLARGSTGSAHGQLPLPAPATLELLRGAPIEGRESGGERVTPTGAALVTSLAGRFGELPAMTLDAVGYGAGSREQPAPNVLRVIIGRNDGAASIETLVELATNVDDMNPEFVEYVQERLFAAGALDVSVQPIQMKKNRPGFLLAVLSTQAAAEALTDILFRETTTLGVRSHLVRRRALPRRTLEVATPYGQVRVKVADVAGGPGRATPEYADCAALARAGGASLLAVYRAAVRAAEDLSLTAASPTIDG
jgi:uncharacterized protein (TIGR00299 family) protein